MPVDAYELSAEALILVCSLNDRRAVRDLKDLWNARLMFLLPIWPWKCFCGLQLDTSA